METKVKIIIADDHPLFRSALSMVLTVNGWLLIEANDIPSLQIALQASPDTALVLLDLNMPGAEGFSGLVFIKAQYPNIPVLVISANDSNDIIEKALLFKATGFLPKISSPEDILNAVEHALQCRQWVPESYQPNTHKDTELEHLTHIIGQLTPQQFRIASLLVKGLLNKQIAYELEITEATVKAHMTEIMRKLEVHSRTQAVLTLTKLSLD